MQECPRFRCSNPEHTDQFANYICKNEQCIDSSPICTLCAFSIHNDHSIQPLKMIIHRINQDAQSQSKNLTLLAQIDVLKQKLYQTCLNIKDLETQKNIRSSIDHYLSISLSKASFSAPVLLNREGSEKFNEKQAVSKIISYQKKYSQLNAQDEKGDKSSNYSRLLVKMIQDMQQVSNSFQDIVKKGDVDNSTSQLFTLQQISKKFRFSSKYKHANISITEDHVVKMPDQYVNYNYYALCEPKLSFSKPQSITFQMVNLNSYITLGICNINKIPKNYEFNTGETSHGSYQISYDGYSWGDNNSAVNSQYTNWYYSQGDKVTLQFNPKTKKLKFFKNGNQGNGYELPIEFDKKQKLYFCVTLNTNPEQVHIIS